VPNHAGIPTAVVNPNATATQTTTQAVPPNTSGVAPSGRATSGGMSTVDKQLRCLQIDMTDIPVKKTLRIETPNKVTAAVYESEEKLYTEEENTTDRLYNVSVNSDPGDPNSTAEAMKSPEWKHWR
jgi:hypothetical protein